MHGEWTGDIDESKLMPRGVYPVDPNLSAVLPQIRFSGVTRCAGPNDADFFRPWIDDIICFYIMPSLL